MGTNFHIAKNAFYLYFRTIITVIIGIYTTRIILQTLGVEDYGIYAVTGGIVTIIGFLNVSMNGATSRFITYELGYGDKQRLKHTFCSAMIVHLIIAFIVLILAETIGLWFLYSKLVIPDGRMVAAEWVFHMSVLSSLLSITQSPYSACMIAHERFKIYAYIDMFSAIAKLSILYAIRLCHNDRLITYSILLFLISFVTCLYSRIYCIRHFEEARFRWILNKQILKPMITFSGWEFFGNIGTLSKRNGTDMLLNMFYGVKVNAAVGIGNTVSGAVVGLTYNIISAFNPSIIKAYAKRNVVLFEKQIIYAATFAFIVFGLFSIPLIVERNYVMHLWLGVVPQYATDICAISLFFNSFAMISCVFNSALQAMGKNRGQNINVGINGLLTLLLVYIVLRLKGTPIHAYFIYNGILIINLTYNAIQLGYYTSYNLIKNIVLKSVIRPLFLYSIIYMIIYLQTYLMGESFISLLTACLLSISYFSLTSYFILLKKEEREYFRNMLLKLATNIKKN